MEAGTKEWTGQDAVWGKNHQLENSPRLELEFIHSFIHFRISSTNMYSTSLDMGLNLKHEFGSTYVSAVPREVPKARKTRQMRGHPL